MKQTVDHESHAGVFEGEGNADGCVLGRLTWLWYREDGDNETSVKTITLISG